MECGGNWSIARCVNLNLVRIVIVKSIGKKIPRQNALNQTPFKLRSVKSLCLKSLVSYVFSMVCCKCSSAARQLFKLIKQRQAVTVYFRSLKKLQWFCQHSSTGGIGNSKSETNVITKVFCNVRFRTFLVRIDVTKLFTLKRIYPQCSLSGLFSGRNRY